MTLPARSAIFSLSGELDAPPGAVEDASPGRLVFGSAGERNCFVHRLTSAGATLTVSGPVTNGDRATIELPFGLVADGAIVGNDPAALAFRFDEPLDVVGALARCLAALPAERREMPRIELRQRLCVRHGDQVDFAWTRNLSPSGIGVETRALLTTGAQIELTLDGLRPIQGEVRWAEKGQAGIAFTEELGWQLLMPWLRKVASQRRGPALATVQDSPSALGAVKDALRLDIATHVRSGVHWWNAQLNTLSSTLAEFESDTEFAPGRGGTPGALIPLDPAAAAR